MKANDTRAKNALKALFVAAAVFLFASCETAGKKLMENMTLAVFPFETFPKYEDAADAIAASVTQSIKQENSFGKILPITPQSLQAIRFEEYFQQYSGYTDTDTIFEVGRKAGATHILAGYLIPLHNGSFFVTAEILEVESLRQIAGYYQFVDNIDAIDRDIPQIAQALTKGAKQNAPKQLPGLAVPPFASNEKIDEVSARIITHIISCELTNGNVYAVLPRTESVEKIQEEYQRQEEYVSEDKARVGAGLNAQYVLSSYMQRYQNLYQMYMDVLDIRDGKSEFGVRDKVTYGSINQKTSKTVEALVKKFTSSAIKHKRNSRSRF
jgi:hypothetical protein